MTDREALSLYVIRASMGLGGGFLASIFADEAYLHGGLMVPFAVGIFLAVGLAARVFGQVKFWAYCAATLGFAALLLLVGLP